ncbi:hypothetical protein N7478_007148 [Penicillium angulare]|uniref:uncharacterized protein n=1 Tax=Penicillium angulare TaxID=116970 RepID=UPI00253FA7A8|nr:uncharacterized protein N7478_007148 [Penicillium angulare]KAJ5281776.1 hypothetical protein N7478_007148 [Penicillium angulare]
MSRAQKLIIIIGNLQIWDEGVARWISKTGTASFLSNILFDCVKKGHVLTWRGKPTVEKPGADVAIILRRWMKMLKELNLPYRLKMWNIDGEHYSRVKDEIHTKDGPL